jgi:pimeloyl-ACP methyl ester carboxylesterase
MPILTANGADIYYEVSGDGPETIVFAHGLLWSGEMYRRQIDALSPSYRCISFDFRGQGRSSSPEEGYDLDTLTSDVETLLEHLKVDRCHFVGLSMGGFVGLRLAASKPELVASLALLNSAADDEPLQKLPKYKIMTWVVERFGTRAILRPVLKIMFARDFLRDPAAEERRQWARQHLLDLDINGTVRAANGVFGRKSAEHLLGRIAQPTVVIIGAEDKAIAPRRSRAMATAMNDARWIEIPNCGHSSSIEKPERVVEILREHLERVSHA